VGEIRHLENPPKTKGYKNINNSLNASRGTARFREPYNFKNADMI
jgi:hypothetical protein